MAAPASKTSKDVREFHTSWILWAVLLASIVILILAFAVNRDWGPSRKAAAAGPTAPRDAERELSPYERANREPPLYLDLDPGQTELKVAIELKPNEWSREIVTPLGTSWRYDVRPPNGCLIWFRGEAEPRTHTKEMPVKDFGIWRGIFRLKGMGSEPQKATITIAKSQ